MYTTTEIDIYTQFIFTNIQLVDISVLSFEDDGTKFVENPSVSCHTLVHVVKVEKRAPLFSPPLLPNITSSKLSQEVRISIVPIFCFY